MFCGGGPITNSGSACPYSLRNSTSTSQGSPSLLFAGSSKSSGSLDAKKKSSLLICSSPVDYLDEVKLRELTASSSIDRMLEKAPEDLKNLKKEDLRTLEGLGSGQGRGQCGGEATPV
ncbi:ubiquitin-protein ligase [Culex quinquefasciatus]|uniref:Ubiquitin-protein ligase n=1 Tax=Culex quinquefasciatus TaxID=7176 RepID=B0X1W7_CULQU|nr:ubiquitin-protein ligase [Culex quinquefasciatus]|eukprot:XP_001863639.1 ubiquitin-protein ligase [Culex quinquefasciatus]